MVSKKFRRGIGSWMPAGLALILSLASVSAAAEVINLGGSGTGLGPLKLIAEAYEKTHQGIKIKIFPSLGSSGGIKAALQGKLHVVVTSRPLKEEERKQGALEIVLARTPYVFVAHPKVTRDGLTNRELQDIYTGTMSTWPNGMRIRLVLRPEDDTDTVILKNISPEMERSVKIALAREGMIFKVTDQESSEAVARTAGAFGASTLTQIITEKLPLNILSFNGVKPGVATLADGSYPLYKQLYIVTVPHTTATARQFIAFVRSQAGSKILAQSGNLVAAGR